MNISCTYSRPYLDGQTAEAGSPRPPDGNSGVTCGVRRTPLRAAHVANTPLAFHYNTTTHRAGSE